MPPRAEAGWCRVGCRAPIRSRSWCRVGYRVPVRGWGRLVPALVVWCPSAGSRSFPRERSSPPPGRGASLRVGSAGPLGLSRQGAAALSPSGCPLDPPGARFVPTPLLSLLPRTHARQQRQKVGDGATVTREGGPLPRRRGGGNSRPLRCAICLDPSQLPEAEAITHRDGGLLPQPRRGLCSGRARRWTFLDRGCAGPTGSQAGAARRSRFRAHHTDRSAAGTTAARAASPGKAPEAGLSRWARHSSRRGWARGRRRVRRAPGRRG
jgi:hypothetical protein